MPDHAASLADSLLAPRPAAGAIPSPPARGAIPAASPVPVAPPLAAGTSLPEGAGATRSDFRVVPLQHYARGGSWRTEAMRAYRRPVLLWFTRGQGRITISGTTRGYGAHNAIFLPGGTMHGFEMTGRVFGTLLFFPDDAALDLPCEPLHLRFREAALQSELTLLIDSIRQEAEADLPGRDRALLHYGGLLSVWLLRQSASLPDCRLPDDTAHRLVAAYTALIERDFHRGRTVAEYAAELGITSTHLSRVCNIACGRPASALLQDRILFEARRLLRDTDLPVKEIARHLGFASAAYFTRAFNRSAGAPPSAFRRASRAE